MATTILTKVGYGQVEPNHLSAQRTAQIYAQLPAAAAIDTLQNGQFVKYDYVAGKVNFTGAGEWMLVFNEVKLYDGARETYKDFAMKKTNYTDGEMTPRVFKTNPGDIFTTNLIKTTVADTVAVGDLFEVDATDGILAQVATATAGAITFQVGKVYTLADGQKAVKVVRIK